VLRNTRDVHTKSAKWFVAGFGVAADERFTAVLDSITKAAAIAKPRRWSNYVTRSFTISCHLPFHC
jgi:hypothetical protein